MSEKLKVNVEDIEKYLRYFKEINNKNLRDIVWLKDGQEMSVSEEEIREFEFCGLSNKNFPSIMNWVPDDIGIKVHQMFFTSTNESEQVNEK